MSGPILPLPPGKHIEPTEDGDYAAYYGGELLGYRPTRPQAQALADAYVYQLLTRGQPALLGAPEASEL